MLYVLFSGKLPINIDDDAQQVFTKTALELPQQVEEITTFSISDQDEEEFAPPLPPKPLIG